MEQGRRRHAWHASSTAGRSSGRPPARPAPRRWAPRGPVSLGSGKDRHKGNRIVPRGRLGVQQFSIRDSITRLNGSVTGYLGGPNFPADATDLGPRSRFPAGSPRCSSTSPRSATAASSSSRSRRGRTARSRSRRSAPRSTTRGSRRTARTPAGWRRMGIPRLARCRSTSLGLLGLHDRRYRRRSGRTDGRGPAGDAGCRYAARAQHGRRGARHRRACGTSLPPRSRTASGFFADPAHPSCRPRSPPRLVHRQHHPRLACFRARHPARVRWAARPLPRTARRAAVRRARLVRPPREDGPAPRLAHQGRRPARPAARPATNPFTQTLLRTGFPLTRPDVVYALEGSIAHGYPVDPDPAVIGSSGSSTAWGSAARAASSSRATAAQDRRRRPRQVAALGQGKRRVPPRSP